MSHQLELELTEKKPLSVMGLLSKLYDREEQLKEELTLIHYEIRQLQKDYIGGPTFERSETNNTQPTHPPT